MRNRNTIEFLGLWERLNNPGFNPIEFDGIRKQAGLNSFILTAKRWIDATRAVGLISKAGRYGGTYAHKEIAFEFASWISVEFRLYLIKEFQRLKEDENRRLSLAWNLNRTLSRRVHSHGIAAGRTSQAAQSNRHSPDASSDFLESESAARHERKINPGFHSRFKPHAFA